MNKAGRIALLIAVAALPTARAQDVAVLPSPGGWVAYVDLDGDGLPDSLTTGSAELPSGPAIGAFVQHGLGNGLLGEQHFVECPVGGLLLAGDTMGDGLADIVSLTAATSTSPPQLVVVPNVPGSGFGSAVSSASTIIVTESDGWSTTWFTNRETIADMDGDGRDDLIVAVFDVTQPVASATLTVARSSGDGTFVETAFVPAPDIQFAVGDFNGDGQLDAATIDVEGTLLDYNGTGGGHLATVPSSSIIVAPWFDFGACITSADFDQDGLTDIAAAGSGYSSGGGGVVVIMHATGAGTFAPSAIRYVLSPSVPSHGDLNGDGWPDLVLGVNPSFGVGQAAPGISTCLNDGSGGLMPEIVTDMHVQVYSDGTELPVRDLDGDGLADVGLWFILSGQGDGTFANRHVLRVGDVKPNLVAAGDLDGDGSPDLVGTLSISEDPVIVFLGHGDGTFDDGIQPPIPGNAYELAVADLDTDGVPDLILDQGAGPGTLTASFGVSEGITFSAPVAIETVDASDIAVADLDGNGTLDVVVTRQGKVDAWFMAGDGAGHFSPHATIALGGKGQGLAVADIDGDGTMDVVTPLVTTSSLSLVLGAGSGAFAAPQLLTLDHDPNHVAVADFNEDGWSDLALSNGSENTTVLLAVAPATFAPPVELSGPYNSNDIAVPDMDRDGHLDIVVNTGYELSYFMGHGDGTFAEARSYESDGGSHGLAMGDFNSDGFTDVAVAEHSEKSLSVLLNRSSGLPSLGFQHDAGSGFPHLSGTGTTEPGSKVTLQATADGVIGAGVLVAGLEFAPQPFQGGQLVPSTDSLLPFEPNSVLTGRWPDLPAGVPVYLQAWFPTAFGQAAGSNAVVGITH